MTSFLTTLPTFKNGKLNERAAAKLEAVTVAYLPKPGANIHGLRVFMSRGSATCDRASFAADQVAADGRIYVGLIENNLVTDVAIALDPIQMEEMTEIGAKGFSVRGVQDLRDAWRRSA